MESIGKCAGETINPWKMQMELNIYIFSKRENKTRSRADSRSVRPIKPKAFATTDLPRERDPVVVFNIYSEKRPKSMNKSNALWTLITLQKKSDKSWFKAKEMEVNKLNTLMKTMADKAGLDNSPLTNHSARNKLFKQSKAVLVRFVKTNSCVNIVRQHFPWTTLYIFPNY